MRFRKGVTEQFTAGYEPDVLGVGPRGVQSSQPVQPGYASYPSAGMDQQQDSSDPFRRNDPYHQPPFSAQDQRATGDFHPVTY